MKFKKGRFAAGCAPGSVTGRFSPATCILEGIEHGNMPHCIGAAAQTHAFDLLTGAQTVWTPDPGHKIVVTGIFFTVADATTTVRIAEGSLSSSPFLFNGYFKPGNDTANFVPIPMPTPYVFTGTNSLVVAQTDSARVCGIVQGYETMT